MKTANQRPGVTITDSKTTVLLWAPKANKVALKLQHTQKELQLEQQPYGYWQLETDEIKEGDRYKFVLDGEKELPDPASLHQPDTVHGPSEVVNVQAFNWTDTEWNNTALQDYIIYELHAGTFTADSTFAGIESKLDYLVELGINAIEIMPVAQFPGNRNWGYDGVFPYAVQNSYGGAKGLQQLVDACHKKGLAVVLDVVYNHMGPEGNYFGEFGPYFTDKYNTPWGNAINFDDAGCDAVRHYFIENVLMWFRDFHIDALRMDAVHAIKDFSAEHILSEIRSRVNELMQQTGKKHYLIIECDLNDTRFLNSQEVGGFAMDSQWIDEFHHALRLAAGGEPTGYYSDFSGVADLAKSYRDAYVYDGQYSPHRDKHFGIKAENNPGEQFIVFSQNHDQVGNRMLGERSSELFSFEMQKVMAGAVLTAPYLPMLFMGEEYSEPHRFMYFVSHTDAELAEAVRKGRKAEFAAFHAQGEAPDPVDEKTFIDSQLQWDIIAQQPHQTMLSFYKALIQLRKTLPALHHLNRKHIWTDVNEEQNTLILRRKHYVQEALILMNFSGNKQSLSLPDTAQSWKKQFDSADVQWNGPQAAADEVNGGGTVELQPESFIIYINE
ncbi:malto-oligosyltrehalose trehalohydrolase [Mucilaginibacter sp. Bleaf8]|uniref:malto-oligosyltrehalose trehalohydrolase n=1 Tax=Mucilaginibacter sp. Bleaf8 TaxID=2834430 RepID=UPI001BD0C18F|nr:malto-oligosyltrehalose trehalohydrolase [Mucilaginibacter sp. Bleaf8]MBS7563684.1 malto-oligosyltrehalose trehalohydrolase [Mucilaginibacter sp. Bleaf8]